MNDEWYPIETAPKDGTFIDVWGADDERVTNVKFQKDCWRHWAVDEWGCMGMHRLDYPPTHWRHVPKGPKSE
jgi:hypothetical protein